MEILLIVFGLVGFVAILVLVFIGGMLFGALARKGLCGHVMKWRSEHPGEGIPADVLEKMLDKAIDFETKSSKRPW